MKQFSAQLKKQAESIRLTAAERRALSEQLHSYMEYHPLPKEQAVKAKRISPTADVVESEPFITWHVPGVYFRLVASAFMIVFVVGVPTLAERSVPGDVLYPFKVSVNEGVRSTLTFDQYEKIEWETERLGRRIAEARFLAEEGRLTPEVEAEVAEAVKLHSDAAQAAIKSLRSEDQEEAAIAEIKLASTLDVQSAALDADETKNPGAARAIASAVAEAQEVAEANKSTSTVSYARLSARVEQETTRAEELFASIRELAAKPQVNEIDRRFADIGRTFDRAVALREVDEAAAVVLLQDIISDLQKVVLFMTDIDVQERVSIEELVPMELTPEEQASQIKTLWREIEAVRVAVRNALPTVDDDRAIKISTGLEEITALNDAVEAAEAEGNLARALTLSRQAREFADSIQTLAQIDVPALTAPIDDDTASDTPAIATTTDEIATDTSTTTTDIDTDPTPEEVTTTTDDTNALNPTRGTSAPETVVE